METGVFTGAGDKTIYLSVTDSRGRTSGQVQATITVYEHEKPGLINPLLYRCNAAWEAGEDGRYFAFNIGGISYSTMGGWNTVRLQCRYRQASATSWDLFGDGLSTSTPYIAGNGGLSPNYTYYVLFRIVDGFGDTDYVYELRTAGYVMFFRRGGKGVGIGKACENDNALEVHPDWAVYVGGRDIRTSLQT